MKTTVTHTSFLKVHSALLTARLILALGPLHELLP